MSTTAQPPPPASPPQPPPPANITEEVRFAVVMYGGVSLAIYINGVAQQLLDMVRATATKVGDEGVLQYESKNLSAAGRIYRRIAQFLNSSSPDDALLKKDNPASLTAPVRTKFVVDVISGTSAGGLNGIFLGKALANDQDMGPLQNLWMAEGDLGKLLNDGDSLKNETSLTAAKVAEPQSLLNSERMYEKLLTALHTMDFPNGGKSTAPNAVPVGRDPEQRSPLVEELDVYVTTTDLAGLPISIQLTNTVAEELRHKNVFRFRYCTEDATGEEHDDFKVQCNPFLAFAGRCTSSFPFAFEPMRLNDIWDVLGHWRSYGLGKEAYLRDWEERHFFEDYTKGKADEELKRSIADFEQRSFGDGGYLDNKPFTYATRTLMRRRAVLPVKRKLIYVEPAPEPVAHRSNDGKRPDVLANVTAALLTLPRYETINEDLQEIIGRNELLQEVVDLTERLDADVKSKPALQKEGTLYEKMPLSELRKTHGVFYGTYHRLKVGETTAHLAASIALALGFDPKSDERRALHLILSAWREKNYKAGDPADGPTDAPNFESRFLLAFDTGYRLRRFFFIQTRLNNIARAATLEEVRLAQRGIARPAAAKKIQDLLCAIKEIAAGGVQKLRTAERELQQDKKLRRLLALAINGQAPGETTEGKRASQEGIRKALLAVLENPDDADRIAETHDRPIQKIAAHITQKLRKTFKQITKSVGEEMLRIWPGRTPDRDAAKVWLKIARLYREFEWYDMVIFPMQQGTGAAEANRVEIIRVSPLDSENLIGRDASRKKLAGTALWAFGAFLSRTWRENDMLWGKLDAAEIVIRNLLAGDSRIEPKTPGKPETVVDDLVDEMHTAILDESISEEMRSEARRLICEAIAADPRDVGKERAVRELLAKVGDLDERLKKLLRCCLGKKDLLEYFKTQYEVDRDLEPKDTLRLVGRASRVVGKMTEVLGNGTGVSAQAKFFSRLTSGLWAIIEISVPRSFAWNEARHIRALLYVIGILLVVIGMFWHPAAAPGAVILAATLTLHVFTAWLHGLMQAGKNGKKSLGHWLLISIAALIVGLASWKAIEIANWFQRWAAGSDAKAAMPPPRGSPVHAHP